MPTDVPPAGEPSEAGAAPELRASDADRDRVVDVLRDAAADGRLTVDEFDERMAAALSSRTLRELAALTADLGPAPSAPARPVAAPPQAEEVMWLDQRGGSIRRADRWVVPRQLELRTSWCDVTLDFTDAVITYDTLRVDMHVRGGSLVLVTRPGVIVDADYLRVRYTDIDIRPAADPGAPVVLRVQLAGRMRYGQILSRPR